MLRGFASITRSLAFFGVASACSRDVSSDTPAGSSHLPNSRRSYGRLYRSNHLFAAVVCACALILTTLPTRASTNPSYDAAMAKCNAFDLQTWFENVRVTSQSCVSTNSPRYGKNVFKIGELDNGTSWKGPETDSGADTFPFDGDIPAPPPADPCAGRTDDPGAYVGAIPAGSTRCDAPSADKPGCRMTFTPNGPAMGQNGGGWFTSGTYKPTGQSCNGDPSFDPPAPSTAPPVSCGGASCYDSKNKKYCISTGDGQICVAAPTPSSNPAGSCASGGSNTICAGIPNAPTPPASPASPISDPASEQTGADKYVSKDTSTNTNYSTGVTTSGVGGSSSPSSNGAKPGDSVPASGSSAGGTGKCTAGAICNDKYAERPCGTTPSTAGDPLLSAIAINTKAIACAKDGLTQADIDAADHTKGDDHTASEVVKDSDGTGNLMDSLDSGGFLAHGGCPGFAPVMYFGTNIMPSGGICATADLLSKFMLVLGYILAALVIARVKANG